MAETLWSYFLTIFGLACIVCAAMAAFANGVPLLARPVLIVIFCLMGMLAFGQWPF